MKKSLLLAAFSLLIISVFAQVNYSANDFGRVPAYNGFFQYGTNMGYYGPSWDDKSLADISAGNPAKGVKGVGSKSFHLPLPHSFLEYWGYNVRVDMFNHYASLGVKDNTVFLEDPKAEHRDNTNYGCSQSSKLWKNMYEPIWDGGANGTPVNENNYYAVYVYKAVTTYKSYVKFWEVINEPDLEYGALGDGEPGQPGNWFDNNPPPCNLPNLFAPVFNYIRLLRITYEVVKTVDPTAYVAPGGLGKPGFLDALLRNTDNPANGAVSSAYPLKGGAYFDALSFHMYPQYSLKEWDNSIMGFRFMRHSDAAIAKYIEHKNRFITVLNSRGYNNTTYPTKHIILTENNVPNKPIDGPNGVYIGGEEVQRNYVMKALVESQKHDIRQYYVFVLGDDKDPWEWGSEMNFFGLYKNLVNKGPLTNGGSYLQQHHESGIAYKTTSDLLMGSRYDGTRTASMNLPANIGGAAFRNDAGKYTYVLWAKTTTDLSEASSATYSFPAGLVSSQLIKKQWDFTNTAAATTISSLNISLSGTPVFLTESGTTTPPPPPPPSAVTCDSIRITPGASSIVVSGVNAPVAGIQIFNSSWATVYNQTFTNQPGTVTIPNLTAGKYFVKVNFYTSSWTHICEKAQEVTVQTTAPPPPPPPPPPTGTPDCNAVTISPVTGGISLSGIVAPVAGVQVFNSSWATVHNQVYTNSPNVVNISSLATGTYHVKVTFYTSSWAYICEKFQTLTVGGTGAKTQPAVTGAAIEDPIMESPGLTAAPNPFTSTVMLTVQSSKTENVSLSVVDVSGKEVFKKQIGLVAGINRIPLDGSKFIAGTYFVRMIGEKVRIVKVVKN